MVLMYFLCSSHIHSSSHISIILKFSLFIVFQISWIFSSNPHSFLYCSAAVAVLLTVNLRMLPRAWCVLSKSPTLELHPNPSLTSNSSGRSLLPGSDLPAQYTLNSSCLSLGPAWTLLWSLFSSDWSPSHLCWGLTSTAPLFLSNLVDPWSPASECGCPSDWHSLSPIQSPKSLELTSPLLPTAHSPLY